MTAWAATAIRQKMPDAEIVWAVDPRCSPVIERERLVSNLALFPRDRWKRQRWSPRVWREQILAYAGLRKHRFDVGFDFQGHSKTALCLRLANPARRFAARATDALAAKLNPPIGSRPDDVHTVEWNHRVICRHADFDLPERPIMPDFPHEPDRKLVTIMVGAGQPEKTYPAALWTEVARALLRAGLRIAFLGGPTDGPIQLEGSEDHVGKLPLEETMRMVACSAVHLASDTGTGHMAAAYGVPVVSVFSTMDPREYRPYTKRGIVLRQGADPSAVPPEAVIEAARSLLGTAVPD